MDAPLAKSEDRCPICGNTTQNTPGLRFKINTKCYHRICESCVDRVFSSGKANCPVAGCNKSLWKREWRTQTFEDLQIEKEVERRKEVYGTLDRNEDDFIDKRAYDDFLELREEIVMNLLYDTDLAATRRKLRDYRIANGLKVDKEPEEASGPKTKPVRKFDNELADPSGLIKGLKKIFKPKARSPYDPFMGMPRQMDYFQILDNYDTGYDQYKSNEVMMAGGYNLHQAAEESLLRAFAGLGIFIQDEKVESSAMNQTIPDPVAAKVIDDVF